MAIDPNIINILSLQQLDDVAIALDNLFPTSGPLGRLGKNTFRNLIPVIAPYVASIGGSGYVAVTGTVLPNPTSLTSGYTLVQAGTFTQTTGGNVVTTQPINILSWNGTTWTLTAAIPIDLSNFVAKTDPDYISASATVRLNDLTDAESTVSSIGRWVANTGTPTFSIVSGKLRITFTAGQNQSIGIPGLIKNGIVTNISLKIKVISGTVTGLKVGIFGSVAGPNTLAFNPTTTEATYTGIITPATNGDFSVGLNSGINTGQVIEIDDIFSLKTNPLLTKINGIDTAVTANKTTYDIFAGTPNILDSDTSNMNGTGGKWLSSTGSPVISFSGGFMTYTLTTGNQSVVINNILTIGSTYTVKVKIRKVSGSVTKLRCGSFATLLAPGNYDILPTSTSLEYTNTIVADSTYYSIGCLAAENTGGVLEIDSVVISTGGTVVNVIDERIASSGSNSFKSVFSNANGVFASLSRYDKPLTKIGVLGDSLMANAIGGSIPGPNDEGDGNRPIRLTYNNIARRLYDQISYNKATHVRLGDPSWTKNGTWSTVNTANIFEPTYTNETYYENIVANSYVEFVVPSGKENFAFICQRISGLSGLTITLNGGSIATYGPSSVTCNIAGFGHTGNPYYTVQYLGLPAGANTIRITRDNTTSVSRIWGGFHWTGNTIVVHNISHGGHTVNDLLQNHAAGEIQDNNFDSILFELPIMNDAGRVIDAGNTIAASKAALTNMYNNYLIGKDLLVMSCNPYGTDPSDGTPNYYTLYPGMEEMKDGLKSIILSKALPFIDVFEVFRRKIEHRGGTLIGGQGGIYYTTDGQHGNPEGVREWWNIIKSTLDNNPIKNF